MIKNILFFLIPFFLIVERCPAYSRPDTLRYKFYFPAGSSILDLSYRDNSSCLDSAITSISSCQKQTKLRRINLRSGASPEGNTDFNKHLSKRRLSSLRAIFQKALSIPSSKFVCSSLGEDWDGLYSLVKKSDMPYREEVLDIIRYTPVWVVRNGIVVDSRKRQLMNLQGGSVWKYMNEHFFPELRNSSVVECEFEPLFSEENKVATILPKMEQTTDTVVHYIKADTIVVRVLVESETVKDETTAVPKSSCKSSNSFCMGVKTNLLYDALLVPNIGVEFHLGKGWSLGGNWMYAWWHSDRRYRYWRVYGGEVNLRKYLGYHVAGSSLTGHHIGVYGQVLTYDFEMGGRGYMGGHPGGSLRDRANYGGGFEYGYSLPIGRRLNLDFSLGIGYLEGICHEYVPIDGHYVWERTKKRHWFGPTKAEISLVWFWGRGNYNEKKGGKQ